MAASVHFEHVGKIFHGAAALENISLNLPAGSFTVFVGPSGCGKSTILNLVAGLDAPSSGQIRIDGKILNGPADSTALLFQNYNLFPWMTASGNIAFALRNNGLDRKSAHAEASRLLAKVGLGNYAEKVPRELSGGMKQRVAILRAFALKPKLLLLDEPFAALDHQTRKMMQAYLLSTWRHSGATVLMVTHDLSEAIALADRVILISGSPGSIRDTLDLDMKRPRNLADPALLAMSRKIEAHLEAEVILGEFSAEERSIFANDALHVG